MTWWADASARAVGLSGHLLDEAAWRRVRACPDAWALCRELQRFGYAVQPGEASRSAERALEGTRGARQSLLARWLGPRVRSLRLYFEADAVRAIRVLLRAASIETAAEPAEGLPPASGLTVGMQAAAAAAETPEKVLATLAELGQPLAERALVEHGALAADWPGLPPLVVLEQALLRAHVGRALDGVRRRDRALHGRVRRAIDLINVRAALSAGHESGLPAGAIFVAGGNHVGRERVTAALETRDSQSVRELLGAGLPDRLAAVLTDARIPVPRLERALLALELEEERREAQREPLGPAPVLAFLLRQRLEVRDLRGLLWARALGAPPDPERWT